VGAFRVVNETTTTVPAGLTFGAPMVVFVCHGSTNWREQIAVQKHRTRLCATRNKSRVMSKKARKQFYKHATPMEVKLT
jgi:hypothetical protein